MFIYEVRNSFCFDISVCFCWLNRFRVFVVVVAESFDSYWFLVGSFQENMTITSDVQPMWMHCSDKWADIRLDELSSVCMHLYAQTFWHTQRKYDIWFTVNWVENRDNLRSNVVFHLKWIWVAIKNMYFLITDPNAMESSETSFHQAGEKQYLMNFIIGIKHYKRITNIECCLYYCVE